MAKKPRETKEQKAEKDQKTLQEFLTLVEQSFELPVQETVMGPTIGLISKELCIERLQNPVEKKKGDMFVDLLYEQQATINTLKKTMKELGDILRDQSTRLSELERSHLQEL